ncbi:hypothetical protein NL676_032181 [Syzygium grande]|nr:hypothetical protein NL676_032181 [Syzygium grande]
MVVLVAGKEAVDDASAVDGVIWFWRVGDRGRENKGRLSLAIVERMKWKEKRVGWASGDDKRVKRVEEYGVVGEWKRIACNVLVERLVLTRMDGTVMLANDFKPPSSTKD